MISGSPLSRPLLFVGSLSASFLRISFNAFQSKEKYGSVDELLFIFGFAVIFGFAGDLYEVF